jgi:hypothetical protein
LTSALEGGGLSAARPGRFTPKKDLLSNVFDIIFQTEKLFGPAVPTVTANYKTPSNKELTACIAHQY